MDLREIRRLVIIALFSDDELMERFVLKGGNALDIVYSIGNRSSVDIDLSISDDFTDVKDAESRIFNSLKSRFAASGYVVFDESFSPRPSRIRSGQSPRWGGYAVEFKLIDKETFEKYKDNWAKLQQIAAPIDSNQGRKFKIDISKYEFIEPKEETELDDFTIYVYSLPMMVIEKLRAICQQLPEYEQRGYSTPRARDFYDIHTIVTAGKLDITTPENVELVKNIFEAKEVPLNFLEKIYLRETRDFHSVDWEAVKQSTTDELEEFDFYFDFVVQIIDRLKAVGII
jgi:predicted nucleotidyltransferase component of viral defense system